MKGVIRKLIEKVVGKEVPSFSIEVPVDKNHGDYATNIALVLAKKTGKNPIEVANEIVVKIGKQKFIEKIEVAGPGFINFYFSKDYFTEQLKKIDKNAGNGKHAKGWKVFIEHTQPNPFKVFHVGHLMNNTVGESVARIIKANGAIVKTASYHGDVGLHVAKGLWTTIREKEVIKFFEKDIPPNTKSKWEYLLNTGRLYAYGNNAYETDGLAKKEIIEINKKIYEKSDTKLNKKWKNGIRWFEGYFETICKKLGSKFNHHFYESEAGEAGGKLVLGNMGNIFSKGENGAIVFEGEKFKPKTHTRVFINSEGFPTYEGKEVGLAQIKKSKFNYDASITVTANEQNSFFNVVEVAIGEVFPKLKGKMRHLSHGLLKLPSGKMSSRTGTIISAEELINQVKEKVLEKAKDRNLDNKTVEQIAIGALKYSILKQSIGSDIIFDFEKSISFEGDSGPYLQYSYVRAISVLAKAKVGRIKASLKNPPAEITQLEKMMIYFPEIVQKAGKEYQPHYIALYLIELAREFNNYYAHTKIVDKEDAFSPYKVALTQAFSIIMKNGLWLLGIEAPEKM